MNINKVTKNSLVATLAILFVFSITGPRTALAATTPDLGAATTFGVLSGTYVNTVAGTTINGDAGWTTVPDVIPAGGPFTGAGALTATARSNAADALIVLSAEDNATCTETLGEIVNLSTVTGHTTGIYTPGVYCSTGAMSIGTGGITLSGAGTYIFRADGALTSADGSIVTLANGASSCDVFWTPTEATTLGANTTFVGTTINDATDITVGNLTTWIGRALSLGAGKVTTSRNTITSACLVGAVVAAAGGGSNNGTITVVKTVINDSGGTKKVADFPLFVNGQNVGHQPVVSGETNTFLTGGLYPYTISETANPNYTSTFSGDCNSDGLLNLRPDERAVCIITNNDKGAPLAVVPPLIDVVKTASPLSLPAGPGSVVYTYTLRNTGTVPVTDVTMVGDTCSPIVRASGDTNRDNKLDLNETWVHTCTQRLLATHTNTVTATGWANGISAVDIASATVVVGLPIVPPLIHVVKVPSVFTLSAPGGAVTYTYTVTNPGTAPLSDVSITDDKCTGLPGRVVGHPGDLNKNNLLDPGETWQFTCKSNLTQTTTNIGTAAGSANGLTARDFAIATVVVASPKLPNTGLPPQSRTPWDIFISAGILMLVLTSLVITQRKS